jgi:hypothetical protein
MIKVIELKYLRPKEALRLVQESGVIPYMVSWGCNIDEPNNRLVFQLKHGGGSFDNELQLAAKDLEKFIKSIDKKN